MNFRNILKRTGLKPAEPTPRVSTLESAGTSVQPAELSGWDSVAALNPDAESNTTFDDLAQLNPDAKSTATFDSLTAVPFAGEPVTSESLPDPVTATLERHEAESSPELQAFKNFFKTDLRVKRELMQAAPRPTDDYDESSRMEYAEQAYRTFRDFRSDFRQIERDFQLGDSVSDATNAFFQRGTEHFALGNYASGVAEKLYRDEFTDMRPDFVEKVKDTCVGYTFGNNLGSLIQESKTVNELMHAYHSYIVNNENILQKVPVVAEKTNNYGYPITLRGEETPSSRQVFDALPDDLDVGWTEIIGADEHIIMMVRDRGHALTLDASPDTQSDRMWVEYNIPKICNAEMIQALPGLAGYSENGARGGFFASRDDLGPQIASFIARVPTDSDIPGIHE